MSEGDPVLRRLFAAMSGKPKRGTPSAAGKLCCRQLHFVYTQFSIFISVTLSNSFILLVTRISFFDFA